jgi:hypothetical protein
MAHIASVAEDANDWLPEGIAAGCLYAAALATGGFYTTDEPEPTGHRRSDRARTEMSICQIRSITPASTRRYAQVAAVYIEYDTTLNPHTRSRLACLASR